MRIVSIVGARPQFIKASAVSRELRKLHTEVLVHTGQHYDYEMSQVFFEELQLPQPDYNLEIGSASHGVQTGQMLMRIEEVLMREDPHCVLVYGDTNSTLGGALAAAKLHIPVAHVEAGMRSFNMRMPEEINRRLADHVSKLLFCSTTRAAENLAREGIKEGVYTVGDVMYDIAVQYETQTRGEAPILRKLGLESGSYLLLTLHRASNTDNKDNLFSILHALDGLDETVVFPVHPRTRKEIERAGWQPARHIRVLSPTGYLDTLALERNARIILTDSGGVQKEAYVFGVPCLTLREETEWVETVENGWNLLVGADARRIRDGVKSFQPSGPRPSFLGDGRASQEIARILSAAGFEGRVS